MGIDASFELIEEARRRARALPPGSRPVLVATPMQRLPANDQSFDLVLSLNTSIGYGSQDEDAAALEELRRVLRPGAALVLETISATAASEAEVRRERLADGTRVTRIPAFNSKTTMVDERQIARFPGGLHGRFDYCVRAYDPEELAALAREAGFRDVAAHGDLLGTDRVEGGRMVLVGRSPA
jgi:ubiquinone/menaquinone biosynthesis C-methylase UbiE